MNFNFDINGNYFDHPKRQKVTKEEKWAITLILNTILFFVLCYICYKYHNDVMYKVQIQIAWISKKYVWFNSRGFCIFLFILFIICLWSMKWWLSLISLIFYLAILPCFFWMKRKYVYTDALLNGMIWYRELFNYNVNIYLYKALEVWQVQWVVRKELEMRPNVVSFWIYWECRYFWYDPYIMHFFDDFVFDWNDCENYERIRNQIDKYQFAKIALKKAQNVSAEYQYVAENKGYFLFKEYAELVMDYFLPVMFGLIILAFLIGLIYFHFFENPFWYRVFPEWFPRPVEPEVVVEQAEPYIPTLTDIMIRQFGKISNNVDVPTLTQNLKYLVSQNYELIKEASKMSLNPGVDAVANLPPEVIHKAFQTLYPSMLANQNTCVEILKKLEEMNNSPFEQFEVNVLQRISLFGLDFSFSNLTLYLILAIVVILVISSVINRSLNLVPNYWQSVIEIFYSFIFSMLIDQAGKKAKVFFPAIFSLFFFILVSNLLGLIPLSFAVTSHVVITFCLGFGFFVAWIIVAFKVIGLKIFNIFWPTNVPLWLRPLLMVVEILSFSLRPLSLSIRLFVNILAGHILLHLVAGSVVLVFSKAAIFSFIPFVLLLAVFCLELGIAFLQAYIFSILLCIYLHDSYHVHGH